jgi:hypothetical protein
MIDCSVEWEVDRAHLIYMSVQASWPCACDMSHDHIQHIRPQNVLYITRHALSNGISGTLICTPYIGPPRGFQSLEGYHYWNLRKKWA